MYGTFSILEDLCHESYVIHRLENVLTIVMCAVFPYFTPEAGVFCTKFEAAARLFRATAPFKRHSFLLTFSLVYLYNTGKKVYRR